MKTFFNSQSMHDWINLQFYFVFKRHLVIVIILIYFFKVINQYFKNCLDKLSIIMINNSMKMIYCLFRPILILVFLGSQNYGIQIYGNSNYYDQFYYYLFIRVFLNHFYYHSQRNHHNNDLHLNVLFSLFQAFNHFNILPNQVSNVTS